MHYVLGGLFLVLASLVNAVELHIAAASNLRFVLPELIADFEFKTGHHIAVSYAASGTLTTQIQHGAPFDVLLSANPSYIQRLIDAKLTQGLGVNYTKAQLALFAAHHSTLKIDAELNGLKEALTDGKINKIAIANYRHAPYGQAARLILEQYGVWSPLQRYLVTAENASQVMQFSLLNSVEAGFVPYNHIIQPEFSGLGRFVKLDSTLQQQAIVVRNAKKESAEFMAFLQSQQAQSILIKHGFLIGEQE